MNGRAAGYAVAALLLILLAARFVNLDSDPPLHYVGHGSSQITDPYNVTLSARDRVLYDSWSPFGIHRWDIFRNSLASLAAFLVFEAGGVSRLTANLSAVLLQVLGLGLFLIGLRAGGLRRWPLAIVVLLLLVNGHLFFYGRLPFLENGLIFLSGLLFLVFVRYSGSLWGQVLTGAILAAAALAGKLFGLLLVVPITLALIYRFRSKSLVPIVAVAVGAVVAGAAYVLSFFGGSVSTLLQYYSEQSTGMYGPPPGLASVPNFLKMLIIYGGESGFWQYQPAFLVLTGVNLVIMLLTHRFDGESRRDYLPPLFCFVWLLGGILGLMPFFYRPLRYTLFLILPAAALSGYTVSLLSGRTFRIGLGNRWVTVPLLFVVIWSMFTQIGIFMVKGPTMFERGLSAFPMAAFLAALVTGAISLSLGSRTRQVSVRPVRAAVYLIVAAVVAVQGTYLVRGLTRPGQYIREYNREVAAMVDPGAVLTGPFAPALTIDNGLKSIIYMFGLTNVQTDLFRQYPISHVVTDQANWHSALKDFPFLSDALKVSEMLIRDEVMVLYRLPGSSLPMTDFERGALALKNGQADSASFYFGRFVQQHPTSLLGQTHHVTALFVNDRKDEALVLIDSLVADHPDNYVLHSFCRGFYQMAYRTTGDVRYQTLADEHGRRAIELDPALSALQ